MTVPNTAIFNNYSGNDSTTVFPYVYKIFANADLEVIIADANDVQTLLVLDTDYSVSGAGDAGGGNVTYPISGSPLPTGWTISIAINLTITQAVDLLNQGTFFADTHEDALDRLTKISQMLAEELGRSVKVTITSGDDPDDFLTDVNTAVAAAQTAQTAAELAETNAETAETNAETAETNAEAWAAGVNLPSVGAGDAGKRLKVNSGETGYDLTAAHVVGQGARSTSSDAADVAGIGILQINTASGNVIIGGFANGVDGQVLHVYKSNNANNLTLEHNEAGGTQKIFTKDSADLVLSGYGGVTLVYDAGLWFVIDS